jgi:Na+/H+-translocating membrane pyrophosphatase
MNLAFLLSNGMTLSLGLSVLALIVAILLIRQIMAASAGNEKMGKIAAAVQEGAQAYLGRQIRAISYIAMPMTVLVWSLRVCLEPSVSWWGQCVL